MFDNIGMPEILLILVIVIIFFGVGKLPEVGKGLGQAIANFRKAQKGELDDKPARVAETPIAAEAKPQVPSNTKAG
jgi:sec-independent protein translocase protein TatA